MPTKGALLGKNSMYQENSRLNQSLAGKIWLKIVFGRLVLATKNGNSVKGGGEKVELSSIILKSDDQFCLKLKCMYVYVCGCKL